MKSYSFLFYLVGFMAVLGGIIYGWHGDAEIGSLWHFIGLSISGLVLMALGKIIDLLQNDQRFKMNGPDKIKIAFEEKDVAKRVKFLIKTVSEIKG